jgi:hypothetical protein
MDLRLICEIICCKLHINAVFNELFIKAVCRYLGATDDTQASEASRDEVGASNSELMIDNEWCEENSSDKEVKNLQNSISQLDGRKLVCDL